ncbi:DUF4054 domain-containing protein [Agarivorans sp. B2Z047]|uniref:DUF4054 domain-containing protein n=1 Tax=Agarivorans sp. B2Z047 TaxID=2652721 RepID=UPI00128E28A1|nr:DUF4054 domain-containing protein [Agarivorans sp. B2Z047]MPW31952.1 DUF4054 domain-containing protein [Agarivorans sp. B2Z047]UQN41883.1 DUF4054 domain-containing protein [Agarivorans sp. B2Z047]UQN44884.1 DUF4054 domain-containing protein [Agarivorans sp. B2Z047]
MNADLPTFRALYPEFSSIGDEVVQIYIDDADEHLSEQAWGRCYAKALLSYVAHNLALSQNRQANSATNDDGVVESSPMGVVSSASADGLSVGFTVPQSASSNAKDAWYWQTPYGQQFLALRKQCLRKAMLVCR